MSATAIAATERTHEQKLDLLAEVAVHVGLGLKPGQELVMTASLDCVPLARRITEHAYRAGASLVTTLYARRRSHADALSLCARRKLRPGCQVAL